MTRLPFEFTPAARPRPMILDTDWWTDCDDAAAIRLLARAHRAGAISLRAVTVSACMPHSIRSLDAYLTAEGLSKMPLGLDAEATDFGGTPSYQGMLAALPGAYRANADAANAVSLLRQTLAASEGGVELVEIGYPQVLAGLLASPGDAYSALSGERLIEEKVSKLWMMAGNYARYDGGKENNFARNARASRAASVLCERFPREIVFLGWEIASDILTGSMLPEGDLLRRVMRCHRSERGRSSWDPMLCLMAAVGDERRAGFDVVRGTVSVDAETGVNRFLPDANGRHGIVRKRRPDAFYRDWIDALLAP